MPIPPEILKAIADATRVGSSSHNRDRYGHLYNEPSRWSSYEDRSSSFENHLKDILGGSSYADKMGMKSVGGNSGRVAELRSALDEIAPTLMSTVGSQIAPEVAQHYQNRKQIESELQRALLAEQLSSLRSKGVIP